MTSPVLTRIYGGSGFFRVSVYHPSGKSLDITQFRGVPTVVNSYSTADPFSDSSAVLSFAHITGFDRPGNGDLWWLVPYAKITIFWYDMVDGDDDPAHAIKNTSWVWEGFIASEEIGQPYQVQCKGALFQADNFLAAPFYPSYPVPYEVMMTRLLNPGTHPTIGTKPLTIEWPRGWSKKVPQPKDPAYLWFLKPFGVAVGKPWTGLTTRDTGSWQPLLTGYIQNLLANMYTDDGDQWTLMKKRGRVPVLKVRRQLNIADESTLVAYYGAPGTTVSLARDFTQTSNVIYGVGTDLNGSQYSGMQVSSDGESTWYQPYAYLPQVYPTSGNPSFIKTSPVKESRLTFDSGIDELSAKDVARTHLMRFADPGFAGSITMQTDPMRGSKPFNKFLIQAGQSILLRNFRGVDLLMHITTVEVNPEENTVNLTVDSKYRDALTVSEVRARTRDALDPINLLKPGSIQAIVPDMVKPWSYPNGSGVIPSGITSMDATPFFKHIPAGVAFPWTSLTKQYPPSKYPQYYVKVSKKHAPDDKGKFKARHCWQDYGWDKKQASTARSIGFPIKMAQAGSIRLIQLAAVDKNGNPLQIRFHFSIYANSGVTSIAMPMIPAGAKGLPYDPADYYPFFPRAFNTIKPSGEKEDTPSVFLPEGTEMTMGWGTDVEPAGYSPGSKGSGSPKSGMLIDNQNWGFDTTGDGRKDFDPASAVKTAKNKTAGQLYGMLFQDDVPEAYFIGRMFRDQTGGAGS